MHLCLAATLLTSCAGHYRDYSINESGGPPIFGSGHAIASWNRTESFYSASVRLRLSDHPAFCEVIPGHDLVVYASQGYVLPLTANLMQYWVMVVCLPGDVAVGALTPLRWANYDSDSHLQPGEVAVRAAQSLSGERVPCAGKPAGSITLLSRSDRTLQVRVELAIELNPHSERDRVFERGLLSRELIIACQPIAAKEVLSAYPTGAAEEVGIPRLGPHRRAIY
jgi:hypothetical protein